MTEAEIEQEEFILEEIRRLSKYLEDSPETARAAGVFEAYSAKRTALQQEIIAKTLAALQIDKTALTLAPLFDNTEEKAYWFSRSPMERLRHMEILRRINYGDQATARLQRILEFAQREAS